MVITLGRPKVRGIVHGDMLEVEVPLEADGLAWPDEEWLSLFREYDEFPADLEEPRLVHGRLRFEARDDDLRRGSVAIRERVAAAKLAYAPLIVARDEAGQSCAYGRRVDMGGRLLR